MINVPKLLTHIKLNSSLACVVLLGLGVLII